MQKDSRFFFSRLSLLILFGATRVYAEPVDFFERVDGGEARLIIESQTDLWTSPYQNKASPVRRYNFGLKSPIVRRDDWRGGISLNADGLRIGRPDLVIGEDSVGVNSDLRAQSFGLAASYRCPKGSWLSLHGAIESASDRPFENSRDQYFSSHIIYGFPVAGASQWVLGLDRSINRGFLNGAILPIIGTFLRPIEDLNIGFGLPFFTIEWKPSEKALLRLRIVPTSAKISVSGDMVENFWYEIRAGYVSRSYLHTERINNDKRIFYDEKTIEGRVGLRLSSQTNASVVLGRSLQRKIYEGYQVFRAIGREENFDNDYFGVLKLEFQL